MQSPNNGGNPHRTQEAWQRYASGCFAAASTVLTVTAVMYALDRFPLPLVAVAVLLAVTLLGFGFYARKRARR